MYHYFLAIFNLIIVSHCSAQTSEKARKPCGKAPYEPLEVRHFDEQYRAKRSAEAVPPLRITPLYSKRLNNSPYANEIKEHLIQPVISYWSSVLKAKNPITQTFLLPRKCINGERIKVVGDDGANQTYCAKGCEPQERCVIKLQEDWLGSCREMKDNNITETKPKGKGLPETDYILIVDSFNHDLCLMGTNAFSTTCSLESTLDRPIMGYVNICPLRLTIVPPDSEENLMLIKHEIAHALGFSDMVVAFMRDEKGDPRTPRDRKTNLPNLGMEDNEYIPSENTVKKIKRNWKSAKENVTMTWRSLVTPHVLAAAKQHFGCDNLDGVDLDNEDESFHFDRKNMMDELMVRQDSLLHVSAMTLGFFKDTGWYHVDMSKAEELPWGKDLGCTFVQGSCYEYMEQQTAKGYSIYPWCNDVSWENEICVGYANAHGTCNLVRYPKRLDKRYQYFESLTGVAEADLKFYGGAKHMKYCPYVEATRHCLYSSESATQFRKENDLLEEIGKHSMCFNHTRGTPWISSLCRWSSTITDKSSSCRKFHCTDRTGLVLVILGKSFICPLGGGSVAFDANTAAEQLKGKIDCPPCVDVCQKCPQPRR